MAELVALLLCFAFLLVSQLHSECLPFFACRLLERQKLDNGNAWPETIAVVLWGTDNIKTYGESLAQVCKLDTQACAAIPFSHCFQLQNLVHIVIEYALDFVLVDLPSVYTLHTSVALSWPWSVVQDASQVRHTYKVLLCLAVSDVFCVGKPGSPCVTLRISCHAALYAVLCYAISHLASPGHAKPSTLYYALPSPYSTNSAHSPLSNV